MGERSTSSQVDADDGDKIVGNVFGGQRDQVVNQLGSQGAGDSGLIAELLPLRVARSAWPTWPSR